MTLHKKIHTYIWGAIALLLLPACNGILGDIYDEPLPKEKKEFGFIQINDKAKTGRIYIDATDYKQWHYIDLHQKQVVSAAVEDKAPADWDFAIHRYDAKTNNGTVAECDATDFNSLPAIKSLPENAFIPDEWSKNRIIIDLSKMMEGIVVRKDDYYNPCLSKWLHVDTSTMPPIYTPSGKIYILRIKDGSYAAIRLKNYMNDAAVKGFMTIDYLYPVQL